MLGIIFCHLLQLWIYLFLMFSQTTGSIVSGEEIWQYLCHEKVEEIWNAKERTGEMRTTITDLFCVPKPILRNDLFHESHYLHNILPSHHFLLQQGLHSPFLSVLSVCMFKWRWLVFFIFYSGYNGLFWHLSFCVFPEKFCGVISYYFVHCFFNILKKYVFAT
jgi:hypothetical protein